MLHQFGDRLLTAPTWEPLSLAEAKTQARIRQDKDDALILGIWLPAAREYVETLTKRTLPQQQWEYSLDAFPGRQVDDWRPPGWRYGIIRVPRAPLISVESVTYISTDQQQPPFTYTTLATTEYMVDTNSEPGRIAPAPNRVWPATNPLAFKGVVFSVTSGYATAALVPARLKQCVAFMFAHLYENREVGVEKAISLLPIGLKNFISASSIGEYS